MCSSCLSVFLSQFKLLWNRDSRTDSGPEGDGRGALLAEETPPSGPGSARPPPGSGHSDATSQVGLGTRLDEDGDLDVERRPPTASDPEPAGPPRDKVHPTILTQEEEDPLADGARESSPRDIVRIGKCRSGLRCGSHRSADHGPGRGPCGGGSVCRPKSGCSRTRQGTRASSAETESRWCRCQ